MGRIFHCLLWAILATSSAYRQHNSDYDYSNYGYYPVAFNSYNRRHETGPYSDHLRISERATETNQYGERTNRELPHGEFDERVSGVSERSIEVSSSVQRVQHQERRRQQAGDQDSRSDQGSYKILNKFPSIRRGAEDRVVFPDDSGSKTRVQTRNAESALLDNLPENCQQLGICETLSDEQTYNTIVTGALQKCPESTVPKSIDELDKPEIAQRIGNGIENSLCNFKEKVIMPKAGKDKNDKWHLLLNKDDDPIQGYRVEYCIEDRSPCTPGIFQWFKGYDGYCKQQYSYRKMTAVNPDTNETYFVPIRLPSCCSCVAVQV